MERENERELVDRSRRGDGEAYAELVRFHERRLFAFLFRLCQDGELAQELTQESFVKAYFALKSFRGDSAFGTWLHRIGINAWHNHLRARRGHLDIEDVPEPASSDDTLGELIGREERGRLAEAVKALPPRQREALVLRVDGDHPFEEVARLMGCTVGAAKASFHQAVTKLKRALGEIEVDHEEG